MGWPVVITPQALDDLREIVSFIARDSPERARSFGHLLVDTALSLAEHPERGRVVPEQDDPAVREILRGSYRIIYEVVHEPTAVFVLRFWHGARGTPEVPRSNQAMQLTRTGVMRSFSLARSSFLSRERALVLVADLVSR